MKNLIEELVNTITKLNLGLIFQKKNVLITNSLFFSNFYLLKTYKKKVKILMDKIQE